MKITAWNETGHSSLVLDRTREQDVRSPSALDVEAKERAQQGLDTPMVMQEAEAILKRAFYQHHMVWMIEADGTKVLVPRYSPDLLTDHTLPDGSIKERELVVGPIQPVAG